MVKLQPCLCFFQDAARARVRCAVQSLILMHNVQLLLHYPTLYSCSDFSGQQYNPLTSVPISKLLEMIGRSAYFPRLLDRDRSPLGHKPDCRHEWSSEYVRKSMHVCHSVSAACRPAEMRRRRGEIGSVQRSIHVGHRWPNGRQRVDIGIYFVSSYNVFWADDLKLLYCFFESIAWEKTSSDVMLLHYVKTWTNFRSFASFS